MIASSTAITENDFTIITTAVWESEAALENAKEAMAAEFKARGFNPDTTMKKLGINVVCGVYRRSPY